MRGENGSALSSYLMGLALFIVGVFFEPLLMVLGAIIVLTGGVAKFVESRRLKFQEKEARERTLFKEVA